MENYDSWEYTMTEAQVAELERQGCDCRELRAKRQARADARLHRPRAQFGRLEPYRAVPRATDTPFFKDVAGSPPMLFGKGRWLSEHQQGIIVAAAVVQANEQLWDPGNGRDLPVVITLTTDPRAATNTAWIADLAARIAAFRDGHAVPPETRKLYTALKDTRSIFCWKVPDAVSGAPGVEAWCGTMTIARQSELPDRCLPGGGVLPLLVTSPPVENRSLAVKLIPAKYWS